MTHILIYIYLYINIQLQVFLLKTVATGTHFPCFTSTKVQILTQQGSAATETRVPVTPGKLKEV